MVAAGALVEGHTPACKEGFGLGLGLGWRATRRPARKQPNITGGFNVYITESGFETCLGWELRHSRCWDPIAKHISNPDVALF